MGTALVPRLPPHTRQLKRILPCYPWGRWVLLGPNERPPLVGLHGGWGGGDVKFLYLFYMSTPLSSPSPQEVADLALEETSSGRDGRGSSPQRHLVESASVSGGASEVRPGPAMDALLLVNILPSLTYRALHCLFQPFGTVLRIRLCYDADFRSNRCYVIFSSGDESRSACDAVHTLPVAGVGFKATLLRSSNVAEHEDDYVPNMFEDAAVAPGPRDGNVFPPRWFIAYFREGHGNFILAARYLAKELGTIPEENIKRYGKGVLIKAKDFTQAKMLENLPCPADSMFETVKAHPTFNHSKGCVFNRDLYEFSEEQILLMCPSRVHKVVKLKGSANMILLLFHGCLPESIPVGPLHLRVRPFIDRPLQCFSCFGYGHGKRHCSERPRCGNCSALDAHSTAECAAEAYCYLCRQGHQLRSRQCPRYRLEQDILQLANSQHISLGSARRELLYRRKDGTSASTYASSLGTRSSAQSTAARSSSATVSSRPSVSVPSQVPSANRFSPLSCDSVESPTCSGGAPPALIKETHVVEIHASHSASPRSSRAMHKRHRGSAESLDSAHVPPSKVSVADRDGVVSKGRSVKVATEAPIQPAGTPSDMGHITSPVADSHQDMETEASIQGGGVAVASREPDNDVQSALPAAAPTVTVGSRDKSKPGVKSQVPKPGPSRVSVSSPAGPSGLAASRRISLPV